MWVELLSDGGKFTVMNAELLPTSLSVPNQNDNSEYRKLAVHLTNTKNTTISVACIPLKEGESKPSWLPTVKAISEWSPQTVEGDVNADGHFTVADAVLFQKWLLGDAEVKLENWQAADFCKDEKLDVFDFCIMKHELIALSAENTPEKMPEI